MLIEIRELVEASNEALYGTFIQGGRSRERLANALSALHVALGEWRTAEDVRASMAAVGFELEGPAGQLESLFDDLGAQHRPVLLEDGLGWEWRLPAED